MPTRLTTNEVLADQAARGLAQLFMPRDNQLRMKYAQGAADIAANNARISNLDSDTALNTQEYGNRGAVNDPATIASALGVSPQIAQLFGPILGLSTGADDAMKALNAGAGGARMMAPDATEADMRRGYALTGHDAAVNNPFTQGGIAGLFQQESSLNDADNRTEIGKASISAAASRYGSDRQLEASRYAADQSSGASRYGDDLHYGKGGASDRAASIGARGSNNGKVTPADADGLDKLVGNYLPNVTAYDDKGKPYQVPADVDPQLRNEILTRASRLYEETHDAQGSVAQAFKELAQQDAAGSNAVAPVEDGGFAWFDTPGVPAVPFRVTRRPGASNAENRARAAVPMHLIEPGNAASMQTQLPGNDPMVLQARAAIAAGADPAAVKARMQQLGRGDLSGQL